MNTSIKIDLDTEGKPVDRTRYRALIRLLLYLTTSRPDIIFAVCVCARIQSVPKESQMAAVKKILRYLKGSQESDYGGCRVDRKSTSDTCQMLGNRLISWFSKKQNSIATSTVKHNT
ncbi:hypothetical protein DH2020_000697 [Rehmannia glutinosa]|uniref:Uncharacterized protein n=1 Tax=Rehmannia glutinosa TaxID=99300 RepID=A0ABR0XXC5_REHGL